MQTFVCYLSLLLCALPVLSTKYHILNELGNCIVSTHKDRPGSPVITGSGCRSDTVVHVGAPINSRASTFGPVSGKTGLFIGRSKNKKRLQWVKESYDWEFSPMAIKPYHTVHVPKHDNLNWVDAGDYKTVKIGVGNELWHFKKLLEDEDYQDIS